MDACPRRNWQPHLRAYCPRRLFRHLQRWRTGRRPQSYLIVYMYQHENHSSCVVKGLGQLSRFEVDAQHELVPTLPSRVKATASAGGEGPERCSSTARIRAGMFGREESFAAKNYCLSPHVASICSSRRRRLASTSASGAPPPFVLALPRLAIQPNLLHPPGRSSHVWSAPASAPTAPVSLHLKSALKTAALPSPDRSLRAAAI